MARVTPQEYADKMARRLSAATEDIKKGVQRVSTSPAQQAIQSKELMKARIIEAIDNGTWEAGLQNVSLGDWQTAMIDKGLPRVASGINAAKPKLVLFAQKLLPAVDAAAAKVHSMPKGTIEDSIARASTYMREMAQFKKNR